VKKASQLERKDLCSLQQFAKVLEASSSEQEEALEELFQLYNVVNNFKLLGLQNIYKHLLQDDEQIIDDSKHVIDVRRYLLDILVIHKQIRTKEITRLAFEVSATF
jgi:hypothetical protein